MTGNFLGEPPLTPAAQALYDEDLAEDGYVGAGRGCGRISRRLCVSCSR